MAPKPAFYKLLETLKKFHRDHMSALMRVREGYGKEISEYMVGSYEIKTQYGENGLIPLTQ